MPANSNNPFDFRLARAISEAEQRGISAKYDELQQASTAKIKALDVGIAQAKQRELANKNSLVGKLDINPNSIAGQAVNLGASLVSGASRVAGDISSFIGADYEAMVRMGVLSDAEIQAVGRYRDGTATPEDTALIQSRTAADRYSALEQANLADKARARGASINRAFDLSGLVQGDRRAQLVEDLGANFQGSWDQVKAGASSLWNGDLAGAGDVASGLAQLVYNAGEAAVKNPGAAAEYIAENVPQLAMGAAGRVGKVALATSNAGYASENYQQGIAKYQKENNGAYPPEAQRKEMAMYAASLALAEQVGDLAQLKGIGGAVTASKETAKAGFLQAMKRIGVAGAEGVATEGATEGYQTFAEGQANLSPVTAKEIYTGAVIGGIAGGGMTGGAQAVGEALRPAAAKADANKQNAEVRAAQEAAVASGDVTAFADKQNPLYDPAKAIAALSGNSALATATEETKQANLAKASEIIQSLQTDKEDAASALAQFTPEGQAKTAALIAQIQANADAATDPAKAAELKAMVSEFTAQAEADKNPDPAQLKTLQDQAAVIDARLAAATESMSKFTSDSAAGSFDVDATVAEVNQATDPKVGQAAADKIINLAMSAPDSISDTQVSALLSNANSLMSPAQKGALRAFSEARIAANFLRDGDKVRQEIYFGGNGNMGIADYRKEITTALAAGNKPQATKAIAMLSKFEEDHRTKAEMAAMAKAQYEATGRPVQIIRKDGAWEINPGIVLTGKSQLANGAWTYSSPKSAEYAAGFAKEATAITASLNEMRAVSSLKFSTTTATKKEAANVPNLSQAPKTSQAQPGAKSAVQAAQGAAKPGSKVAASQPVARSEQTVINSVDSVEQVSPDTVKTGVDAEGSSKSNENTTSTTEASSDQASQQSAEQTSKSTVSALDKKSAEGAEYSDRQLIGDYFTQSAGSESDSTKKPLATTQNFLSEGWDKLSEFLKSSELAESQVQVLRVFKEKATAWADGFQKNLFRKENQKFWAIDDMMQFLINEGADGKLSLDENVSTAMSYSAFSKIAEDAARDPFNSDEEINTILGRDEDHAVSEQERRDLHDVGVRQNVLINALGQRAIQALGLKVAANAPVDLMPKLQSHMGAYILKTLLDDGFYVRNSISGKDMAAMTGSNETNERAEQQFIKLNEMAAEPIFKASIGTQSVLDKLFSVEPGLKEPSLEPIPFNQKTTKGTNQGIPSTLAAIVTKENSDASYLRQDMVDLVGSLDETIAIRMAGGEEVDSTKVHAANRSGIEAKFAGLQRELQRIKGFIAGMKDLEAPLYFDHSVWKQQRVGISTNVVNPQTSKIHRHMLTRESWNTEVSFDDTAQMENFRLRVAEGLGIKTDKQSNEQSLPALDAKLKDETLQKAVAILQARISAGKDISMADQETLLNAVSKGGENFHTLSTLMALAQQANALAGGKKSFTSQLMGEVDGVTNGPMLSHLLMGAAKSVGELFGLLNRGGFFEEGNEHSQYNLWRSVAGHLDLYETTALHMTEALQNLINTGITTKYKQIPGAQVNALVNAIYGFTGVLAKDGKVEKAGRNIIKTPLTAMVFGSSTYAAVESMANNFVESIYAGIEDTANGVLGAQTAESLINNLNLLLVQSNGSTIPTRTTITQLMEMEFSKEQQEALKRSFKLTVGASVKSTMETDFASYIEQRRQFNTAAETTFAVYEAVHSAMREQMIADLVKSGDIAVNAKTGDPIHDLTKAQEAELEKRVASIAPMLQTPMSKDSGSLRSGLRISKSSRKLSERKTFMGTVKFSTPFKDTGAKETRTRAYEQAETGPGVAMLPMSTHSLDSMISHYAAKLGEVLNVHDAHGAGVGTFIQTAKNLNQATWNAVLNYSPASEMQASLSRTLVGLAGLIEAGTLPESAMTNLVTSISKIAAKQDIAPADYLASVLEGMKATAYKADDIKLGALAQMQSIDQYALQGGNYAVTEQDRAAAAAMRESLTDELSAKETAALETIAAALNAQLSKEASKTETPAEEDPPAKKSDVFGPAGKSTVVHDAFLVDFLKANSKATAPQVVRELYRMLRDGQSFDLELLRLINKVVTEGTEVRFITPEMGEADVLSLPPEGSNARAWYTAKDGKSVIHILSPEFANSAVTVEVLLHELTHASIAQVIANPQGEAKALVAELNALREKAAAYAKEQGITGFDAALADIQEFVTWGMTNQAFQDSVLRQITMESKTQGNSLVDGMKAFISKLVGLLFKGSDKNQQEQAINGMTVLVSNVSGLFAATTQGKADVNQAMANPMGAAKELSTLELLGALNAGGTTAEFSGKLKDLLTGIVLKIHGPFGAFKSSMQATAAMTPLDVWQKALDIGVAPFASSVQASPFVVSQQEAFVMEQVEATVRTALSANDVTTKSTYIELVKLHTEMAEALKGKLPKDQYDFIFDIKPGADGRSNYLARFAAFGLAHQEFNALIQTSTATRTKESKQSWIDRLQAAFANLLELLHERVSKTYAGQQADEKLSRLIGNLVDIEAKRAMTLARQATDFDPMNITDSTAKKIAEGARAQIAKAANAKVIRESKIPGVKTLGILTATAAKGQVLEFMQGINDIRDAHFKERLGFFAGTLNYALGADKVIEKLLRFRKKLEGDRKDIITNTAKLATEMFANKGADITKKESAAITQVFLRTGLHYLTDKFSITALETLLDSQTDRDAAIADLEKELDVFGSRIKEHFIAKASYLAYYKATGEVRDPMLLMNAHNIARLYTTAQAGRLTEEQSKTAQATIEKLVALYALGYTVQDRLDLAKKVLSTENQRSDGNGISFILALHKRMEQEAKDRLFEGQEALMQHGHTPEIVNGSTDMVTATEAEGEQLEKMGYSKLAQVPKDPADTNPEPKFLYKLAHGGLRPMLTGVIAYNGNQAKGSKMHNGYLNANTQGGADNASSNADILAARGNGIWSGGRPDLSKPGQTYLAPILNPQGEVVNWRYMMNDATRDLHLERDNSFNKVFGVLAGSIFDKETTHEVNTKVFEALHADYQANKGTQPESFAWIGADSKNQEDRETWAMLPDEARADALKITGRKGIYVRHANRDVVFGYRKLSLSDAILRTQNRRAENADRLARGVTPIVSKGMEAQLEQAVASAFTKVVEEILVMAAKGRGQTNPEDYAQQAAVRIRQAEDMWMEVMKEVKDIFVIKSMTSIFGNIKSNFSLLLLAGVPIKDMLRDHLVALRGATAYQKDSEELARLQTLIDTKQTNGKEAETRNRIAQLKDAINRNPVKVMIDNGLMPSIVEDVGEEDIYSYKSQLTKKVDGVTSKINPMVKTMAKGIYMSHDTKLYQGLYRITQLSDFMARYALYQHATTRNENRLSQEDAIQQASDYFVNYDLPMHRGMQYLDDMGVLMFSKYFFRIQKAILAVVRDNPGRALATVALGQYLHLGSNVLNSSVIHHLGVNLQPGALQYPGSLDELATVKAAMSLVK